MIVVASGYFNPLHIGHVNYLQQARELGDTLIVIVNNDMQVKLKGMPFMDENERCQVVEALRCVNTTFLSIDSDLTIKHSLMFLKPDIFAKGGDSTPDNVPEIELCKKLGIKVVFGVGGGKIQSSRWLKSGVITKSSSKAKGSG
jgi:cytidyltransferase-like protein